MCVHEYIKNHNSLGRERPSGLDVKQSPDVQDVFQPIPGLISCAGVTGSVGITCHARATQIAGLRSSQSHSLAARGSAHLLQLRLHPQSNCHYCSGSHNYAFTTVLHYMCIYRYNVHTRVQVNLRVDK